MRSEPVRKREKITGFHAKKISRTKPSQNQDVTFAFKVFKINISMRHLSIFAVNYKSVQIY